MLDVAGLTRRQLEVLIELARDGPSNEEIAGRLGISKGTVRAHVDSIYHRTGIHTRAGLVAAFWRWRMAG